MTKETIAIFDALGPIYHYDPKGWVSGAAEGLLARLESHGYHFTHDDEVAQAEEDLQRHQDEQIYIMPGFAETALYFQKNKVRPVIISAGTHWVLENTLEEAAKDYSDRTGTIIKPEQLVEPSDLITTIGLGSKKNPITWTKAIERYGFAEILAVYEDIFANLTAAMEGLHNFDKLGGPLCYSSGIVYAFHVTSTKFGMARVLESQINENTRRFIYPASRGGIFRGHVEEALPLLSEAIELERLAFPNGRKPLQWG